MGDSLAEPRALAYASRTAYVSSISPSYALDPYDRSRNVL